MHDEPSPPFFDLLSRLQLAKPQQVRAVRRRAKRLAGGVPMFDSVWVDALAQARRLTPYQAAEINAGRGERLAVGPYLLQRPLGRWGYAEGYLAVERASAKTVHLVVARNATALNSHADKHPPEESLAALAEKFTAIESCGAESGGVATLLAVGCEEKTETLWAAYTPTKGVSVAQWLACQGRFPPVAALEIARQLAAVLAKLEAAGIVHGDVSATALSIGSDGIVQVGCAGVRGIFRPDEADATVHMPIEAFDYLAPERIADRDGPTTADDVYAFGCVCWHLLTGRPPLVGGNLVAKLEAVQAAKIRDVRHIAPETAPELATGIERCTRRNPSERPRSFAEIVETLGAPTAAGRRQVVETLARSRRSTIRLGWSWRLQAASQKAGPQLAAAAACAMLLAAATWPLWRSRPTSIDPTVAARYLSVDPTSHNARSTAQATRQANEDTSQADNDSKPTPGVRLTNYQTTASDEERRPLPPDATSLTRAKTNASQEGESTFAAANVRGQATDAHEQARPVVELPGETEIPGASLRLQPGAVVCGRDSQRVRILAPPNGVIVAVDDVRFENVDFIWRQRPERITSPDRHSIVELRAGQAEFVGCTFQAAPVEPFGLPPAIRLRGAVWGSTLPPACSVRLERCALREVAAAVECWSAGPSAIRIDNVLHLGRGPLVRLRHPRTTDAPIHVTFEQVTVRGTKSVVEMVRDLPSANHGALLVDSTACVFSVDEGGALLAFSGRNPPVVAGRLPAIQWTGQGSLTNPDTAVAVWRHEGVAETLAEEQWSIEGLVSSPMEFAGLGSSDPAESRLTKWLAPLLSDKQPGIGDDLPTLPSLDGEPANGPP